MRWHSVWVALAGLAVGVLGGCGSTTPRTVTAGTSTSTGPSSQVSIPDSSGGPPAYTSPVQLPLPFDSEEDAFMGNPDPQNQGKQGTGCFAVVLTFDNKSEEVCDCAYRLLRAEGYPASQLAATAASVTMANEEGPKWFNVPIAKCWLGKVCTSLRPPGSSILALSDLAMTPRSNV